MNWTKNNNNNNNDKTIIITIYIGTYKCNVQQGKELPTVDGKLA